ncbi:MAG: RimK family alpha-L-glutamate ligase [Candidatus Aenigmatarchaeota archaeon]|nr:MAG: RimK family alpha-L-glutamate ligase [Candidatus Aenigmarchaeota archaeon]
MKLAILGPSENFIGYTTKRLMEEGKKEFKGVELFPIIDVRLKTHKGIDALYGKKSVKEWDYVLPRIDSGRAEIGYPVFRFLDAMGVKKPYPAETIILAHNKFLTLEILARARIPVPETYLTGSKSSAKEILDKQKLPIIIKLLAGFGGQGVMIMESKDAAKTAIETMKTLKQQILIEEFVPNPGEDIRGIVAGDDVIASYKMVAAPDEKKANIYAGGKPKIFKLTEEMVDIVLRSAKAMRADICAVDMIQNKKGEIFVTEVNINPGIQGIEKTTDINVAQRIISFIKSEVRA